jgi:hypothetical protein
MNGECRYVPVFPVARMVSCREDLFLSVSYLTNLMFNL